MRLATETATGIAYLHMPDVAIVHGDLKAANVLLTATRTVRICDFGMSEAKDRSKSMTAAATSSSSGGLTVAWTAPELLHGQPKSFASDIFALGVTVWEVFMRATPFKGMIDMVRRLPPRLAAAKESGLKQSRLAVQVVFNQLLANGRPPINRDTTPPRVCAIIEGCWAQEAKRRPTAGTVACILTNLLAELVAQQQAPAGAAGLGGRTTSAGFAPSAPPPP